MSNQITREVLASHYLIYRIDMRERLLSERKKRLYTWCSSSGSDCSSCFIAWWYCTIRDIDWRIPSNNFITTNSWIAIAVISGATSCMLQKKNVLNQVMCCRIPLYFLFVFLAIKFSLQITRNQIEQQIDQVPRCNY